MKPSQHFTNEGLKDPVNRVTDDVTGFSVQFFSISIFIVYLVIFTFLITSTTVRFTSPRFLINAGFILLMGGLLLLQSKFTVRTRVLALTILITIPSLAELVSMGLLSFGKTVFLMTPILLSLVFPISRVLLSLGVIGLIFILVGFGFSIGILAAPEPERIHRPVHLVLDTITMFTFSVSLVLIIYRMKNSLINNLKDIVNKNLDLQEKERTLVLMRNDLNEQVNLRIAELEGAKEMLLAAKERLNEQNKIVVAKKDSLDEAYQAIRQSQANLVQSRKMASLGSLSLGIAHEINNPLNFIKGSLIVLEKKLSAPEHHELGNILKIMQDAASRINGIVRSLHQFGPQEKQVPSPCNLVDIIKNCFVLLKPQITGDVQFEIQNPDYPPIAQGFPEKLHQVFLNLLHNAVQAVPADGGRISVSFRRDVERKKLITLVVDNGSGIPSDLIEKVTEAFFTTKSLGQGTGLGLYISKKILDEHNGRFSFLSTSGTGTTVEVELPEIFHQPVES